MRSPRWPPRFLMNIPTDVIGQISDLATSLGYEAATSGQASAYEQIYLTDFIHDHWADFAGKFDGLIDLDYSFLGVDLASQPSQVMSQFPGGGWPVWGLLIMPFIAAVLQLVMSMVSMKASSNTMNSQSKMMMYLFPLMTVWMGFMFPAALCVYWIANAAFSAIQEMILNKYFGKKLEEEESDKEREKREKRAAKMQAARENYNKQLEQANAAKKPQQGSKKKSQPKEEHKEKRAATTEAGRVGNRPYARGRAYSEKHYDE